MTDKIETFKELLEEAEKIGFKHSCLSSPFSLNKQCNDGTIDLEISVPCGYENVTGYIASSKDPKKIYSVIKDIKDCEDQDDR